MAWAEHQWDLYTLTLRVKEISHGETNLPEGEWEWENGDSPGSLHHRATTLNIQEDGNPIRCEVILELPKLCHMLWTIIPILCIPYHHTFSSMMFVFGSLACPFVLYLLLSA